MLCRVTASAPIGCLRQATRPRCLVIALALGAAGLALPSSAAAQLSRQQRRMVLNRQQQRMVDCNAAARGMKGVARKEFMSDCLRSGRSEAEKAAVRAASGYRDPDAVNLCPPPHYRMSARNGCVASGSR